MNESLYPSGYTPNPASRSAFTIFELLIVIGLIAIIAAVSFFSLFGRHTSADLTGAKTQIVAVLREAESRSAGDDQGVSWGVHFSNTTNTAPFFALFYSSYAATTTAGYYALPPSVGYVTSTLAIGSSSDITFAPLSGAASVSTSVELYSKADRVLFATTISVASSGEVSF
jgi:type II secretory pathway pseudopilin PulG